MHPKSTIQPSPSPRKGSVMSSRLWNMYIGTVLRSLKTSKAAMILNPWCLKRARRCRPCHRRRYPCHLVLTLHRCSRSSRTLRRARLRPHPSSSERVWRHSMLHPVHTMQCIAASHTSGSTYTQAAHTSSNTHAHFHPWKHTTSCIHKHLMDGQISHQLPFIEYSDIPETKQIQLL